MPNVKSQSRASSRDGRNPERRVLVCVATGRGASFALRLAGTGYEVQRATAAEVARALGNFSPQIVIVELPEGARAVEQLSLARGLREGVKTAPLPLVFVCGAHDEMNAMPRATTAPDAVGAAVPRAALDAARELGADDCFALATPTPEAIARLDSLFWRVEAARDLASLDTVRGRRRLRTEIDGFIQLLDAARASFDVGTAGALALVTAVARQSAGSDGAASGANVLREAHDFFRDNLRRTDAVAFYGPDLLLAHLPRLDANAAGEDLARLSAEFAASHESRRVVFGCAHFPADGANVETLIERAEAALASARSREKAARAAPGEMRAPTNVRVGGDDRAPSLGSEERSGESGKKDVAAAQDGEHSAVGRQAVEAADGAEGVGDDAQDSGGTQHPLPSLTVEDLNASGATATAYAETTHDVSPPPTDSTWPAHEPPPARRLEPTPGTWRALRESRRGEALETSVLPAPGAPGAGGGGVLARAAAEAAARERDLRARGVSMP
ncbi:MAG: diguanylate cyclase domain-containing protein, partial [Pyrinomonadaceae bacterium]